MGHPTGVASGESQTGASANAGSTTSQSATNASGPTASLGNQYLLSLQQQNQQQTPILPAATQSTSASTAASFASLQQHPQLLAGMQANPLLNQALLLQAHRPYFLPSDANATKGSSASGQAQPLRSGKWIAEEEEYAELLIRLFEKGMVNDCENGSTLRSYLSTRLQCAPMRISKKFAGKGIGKMVYTQKRQVRPDDLAKVQAAHKKFMDAANPMQNFLSVPFVGNPAALMMPAFAQAAAAAQALANNPNNANAIPSLQQQVPGAEQTLHQSYLHALAAASAKDSAGVPAPARTVATTAGSSSSLATTVAQQPRVAQVPVNVAKSGGVKIGSLPMAPLQQVKVDSADNATATASIARTGGVRVAGMQFSSGNTPANNSTGEIKQPNVILNVAPSGGIRHAVTVGETAKQASNSATGDIPDLLSGFDKVVQKMKPGAQATTSSTSQQPPTQHSPPFTSRSFDDFHRFLGKDMVLNETTKASSTSTTEPTPTHDALFTAESYALFAQESALEASQHAAYELQSKFPTHAPDVENMIQLISEQTYGKVPNKAVVVPMPASAVQVASNIAAVVAATESQVGTAAASTIAPTVAVADPDGSTSSTTTDTVTKDPARELTPVERFVGVVSGSEPSNSATSSSFGSSRGSGSEGTDNMSSGNDNTSNDSDSNSDSNSNSGCDPPDRKKIKTEEGSANVVDDVPDGADRKRSTKVVQFQ